MSSSASSGAAPAAAAGPTSSPSLADNSNPDAAPETVNMTDADELAAANDAEASSESGRLRTLLGVLKRMLGVSDMAAVRLSLPANLLEPVGNLEYWTYLDRADLLTCLPELQDPLDRILAVVRFSMTKEFRYVRGGVCKPFNSILGEHFRCHWDFTPLSFSADGIAVPTANLLTSSPTPLQLVGSSSGGSDQGGNSAETSPHTGNNKGTFKGTFSPKRPANGRTPSTADASKSSLSPNSAGQSGGGAGGTLSRFLSRGKSSQNAANAVREAEEQRLKLEQQQQEKAKAEAEEAAEAAGSDGDGNSFKSANDDENTAPAGAKDVGKGKQRVVFLTEQVSHHPPISSYYVECNTGTKSAVSLYGVDQISAKFTGTTVKVNAGEQNQGVFARIERGHGAGEEYQMTHPTASVNGLLRGNLWIALTDAEYVTCRAPEGTTGKQLRAIIEHKDESWVGKAKYAFEGVIYEYEGDSEQYKRVKEVPQDSVVATIEGSWKGRITYTKRGEKEQRLLVNIADLDTIPKSVRPLDSQLELESRRIWEPVINAILSKQYGEATRAKQVIEQRQRDVAAERRRKGEEFAPQYFEIDITDGRPKLTQAGREAIEAEMKLQD
ncbi:unnamed protein product [Tilletia laevis]|uniref:Oxysterol-binding protein n=3 Tax=Tilletia TaxID=13289 RepID=A0A8X7MY25_9BASI|nr:hypothetical protein CF335_g5111 [Tilletia laevis]KAE8203296.1 hypothetical protein CF328_g1725 [Tilletia controversa]KAE8263913.1 hypothetical protein A4X03_0g1332 [Tilletia caries]KAE8198171.1 hypothetical protein CF336_g1808 [Tilletia laevis]KAE8252504.1 hypothetical protein A4X06_0g2150 [Tilletia controversa]